MPRSYHDPVYRQRIKEKAVQNQEDAKAKERESREKDHHSQFIAAIHRVEQELAKGNSECDPRNQHEQTWRRREVWGLWAAAAVGVAAILVGNYDANRERGEMQTEQRAWVGPNEMKIDIVPKIGEDINTTISVVNTGREPALDFTTDVKPFIALANEADDQKVVGNIREYVTACWALKPIQQRQVLYPSSGLGGGAFTFNGKIDKDLIDQSVIDGTSIIVVRGCAAYRTLGIEKHSAFCGFYRSKVTADIAHLNLCAGGNDAD